MGQVYARTEAGPVPVELAGLKAHLKIDSTADDDYLTALLAAVTDVAEKYTRRELRANTWTVTQDCFEDRILLRRDPVASITSVTKLVAGSPVVVAGSVYYLKKGVQTSEVLLGDDQEWPDDDVDEIEATIVVTFVTEAHTCLEQAKLAIMRAVAFLYENRGDCDPQPGAGGNGQAAAVNALKQSGAAVLLDQLRVSRV